MPNLHGEASGLRRNQGQLQRALAGGGPWGMQRLAPPPGFVTRTRNCTCLSPETQGARIRASLRSQFMSQSHNTRFTLVCVSGDTDVWMPKALEKSDAKARGGIDNMRRWRPPVSRWCLGNLDQAKHHPWPWARSRWCFKTGATTRGPQRGPGKMPVAREGDRFPQYLVRLSHHPDPRCVLRTHLKQPSPKTRKYHQAVFMFVGLFLWFCHTSTWVSRGCTSCTPVHQVPHPDPPSHLTSSVVDASDPKDKKFKIIWPQHLGSHCPLSATLFLAQSQVNSSPGASAHWQDSSQTPFNAIDMRRELPEACSHSQGLSGKTSYIWSSKLGLPTWAPKTASGSGLL